MDSREIKKSVYKIVSKGSDIRSVPIANDLGISRKQVNRALYLLASEGKLVRSKENPPKWNVSHRTPVKVESSQENIFVLVDLGNVHDIPFNDIDQSYDHVTMIGFADFKYNGARPKNTFRATKQVPHAADLMLAANLSTLWTNNRGSTFLICSKDRAFQYAPFLSKDFGCTTIVVQSWSELCIYID